MAQRQNFIADFFEGNLGLQDQFKQHIREMLGVMNRKRFIQIYTEAQQQYLEKQAIKDHFTFGISYWGRVYKSHTRFPNDVSDENVREKLKNFLLGPGNKDLKSLKYYFLQQLLLCSKREIFDFEDEEITVMHFDHVATTDRQAENLIDMTLEALGHKPILALVAESFKPNLNRA